MDWARVLAYVTGTLDQELLARNECLAAGPAQNVVRPWNWFAEPRAARALPAQDGYLMSQGDEFELQRGAAAYPEREQMGYWGSPVRRAGRMGGCASG